MKITKLVIAVFLLLFAVSGAVGLVSFDIVVPCVVVCTAMITLIDAKRLESEKRIQEARSVKNSARFMVLLVVIWFLYKTA